MIKQLKEEFHALQRKSISLLIEEIGKIGVNEFARRVGMDKSYISRIYNSEVTPSLKNIILILSCLE